MSRATTLPPRWAALAAALGGVEALAKACGVSTTTIWRWGSGENVPGQLVRQHVAALAKRKNLASPWVKTG